MEVKQVDVEESNGVARSDLRLAVEAVLFAADEPVDADRIARVFAEVRGMDDVGADEVNAAVEALNADYAVSGRAFRIRRWAAGYRLTTFEEVAPYVRAYYQSDRSQRLSRTLLETLAIIAYRQPVTRPEIDFVRGVDSDYAVRKLMEMHLVDVVGRSEAVGRPLLLGTTSFFLEQFGLPDLDALPTLREIEEILNDPAFNRERARLLTLEEQEQALEQVAQAPDSSHIKDDPQDA